MLWFNNVLPSLLPFIVGVNILNYTGFSRFLGVLLAPVTTALFNVPGEGGYALLAGLLSGYPIGAKTVSELRTQKRLTQTEAQRLIGFCNNAGPLFIVGVAGAGLFGSVAAGYCLWLSHVAAALALGIAMRFYGKNEKYTPRPKSIPCDAFAVFYSYRQENDVATGRVLGESVKNAMEAVTLVGGFIIFFSVAARAATLYIPHANSSFAGGLLVGLLEVTNGVKQLALLSENANLHALLIGAAAVIAFGGGSIHAQTFHFIRETDIKAIPYIVCKVAHALLSACFCALLLPFFKPAVTVAAVRTPNMWVFETPEVWTLALWVCACILFSSAVCVWYNARRKTR